MWLNESEIDECVRMFHGDPILGPASRYLSDYRDIVNGHSDGWPYWSSGTKPAETLCDLLYKARMNRFRQDPSFTAPTVGDVQKGMQRIKRFITMRNNKRNDGLPYPPAQLFPQGRK